MSNTVQLQSSMQGRFQKKEQPLFVLLHGAKVQRLCKSGLPNQWRSSAGYRSWCWSCSKWFLQSHANDDWRQPQQWYTSRKSSSSRRKQAEVAQCTVSGASTPSREYYKELSEMPDEALRASNMAPCHTKAVFRHAASELSGKCELEIYAGLAAVYQHWYLPSQQRHPPLWRGTARGGCSGVMKKSCSKWCYQVKKAMRKKMSCYNRFFGFTRENREQLIFTFFANRLSH